VRGETGRALLAVLLLGSVVSLSAFTLAATVQRSATEVRARLEVLCARYGALGGLAAGPSANGNPGLVSPTLDGLAVALIGDTGARCTLLATATCGTATRSARREIDPALCTAGGLRFRPPP
jgi:hypothetical protein